MVDLTNRKRDSMMLGITRKSLWANHEKDVNQVGFIPEIAK